MGYDFSRLNDTELIGAHSDIIRLLKERGIIHSKNVIGDLGEYLAIKYYCDTPNLPKLQPAPPNTKNVDAISINGDRYNIKATAGRVTSAFWALNDRYMVGYSEGLPLGTFEWLPGISARSVKRNGTEELLPRWIDTWPDPWREVSFALAGVLFLLIPGLLRRWGLPI